VSIRRLGDSGRAGEICALELGLVLGVGTSMRRDSLEQEMSFREAAHRLNRRRDSRGRALRAMVLARERQTGKKIAIRLNGEKEPKLRITIGALYRYFPELQPARVDDIARLVRPMLDRTLERASERTRSVVQEEIKKTVVPRIDRLEKQSQIIKSALAKLAKV
jgi:hypothetical protein